MATTFYSKQTNLTPAAFLPNMARFLINDLGGFTGPGWTIVDTYSSAAGTPHEVPGTATDMDSLAADNGWRTGTIVAGDYIILANNNGSYPFQVGIEYQSTTLIRFIVAPKSGFATGNDDADMTAAGNWANAKLTTFDFTVINSSAEYSIQADADHFKLTFDQWPIAYWTYIGLPDTTSLYTGDAYPACVYVAENQVYTGSTTSSGLSGPNWRRLSSVDETTELSCYATAHNAYNSTSDQGNGSYSAASSEFKLLPIEIMSVTAGHTGLFGKLKGLYSSASSLGNNAKGTLSTKAYGFISNSAYAPIVFEWDGSSAI